MGKRPDLARHAALLQEVGKQQLLFLTNDQADILAHPDNIAKLISSFEVLRRTPPCPTAPRRAPPCPPCHAAPNRAPPHPTVPRRTPPCHAAPRRATPQFNLTPKLLIILQWDGEFRTHQSAAGPGNADNSAINRAQGAFLTIEAARLAETQLDHFMLDVLIPLAVQTNAMVICDAVRDFELSASFLRMVAVQRASFPGDLPFSIVAVTDEIHCFYG